MPATAAAFLALDPDLSGLSAGDAYHLDGSEGHHAAKVARIGVGEEILLTDAPGRQVRARVVGASKSSLHLELLNDPGDAVERRPRLALVQALATGGRDEQAVESATELGVDRITPWIADRSVSVWRGERIAKGRAKWQSTVATAVKQCRRPGIPHVDAPMHSRELTTDIQTRCEAGGIVLVLHEQESTPLLNWVSALQDAQQPASEVAEITVVVGPEGGISDEELAALTAAGARSVLLGPEVLRSSTAGPAALAVISAIIGRWGLPGLCSEAAPR